MSTTTVQVASVVQESLNGVSVPAYVRPHADRVTQRLQSAVDQAVETIRSEAQRANLSASQVEQVLVRAGLLVEVPDPEPTPEPVQAQGEGGLNGFLDALSGLIQQFRR